jgi:hypothetical protein
MFIPDEERSLAALRRTVIMEILSIVIEHFTNGLTAIPIVTRLSLTNKVLLYETEIPMAGQPLYYI